MGKKGRSATVNIDQVRIYHPRNSETSSYDSINETTFEGKESSNWSNRSNLEKSRRSRKFSGEVLTSAERRPVWSRRKPTVRPTRGVRGSTAYHRTTSGEGASVWKHWTDIRQIGAHEKSGCIVIFCVLAEKQSGVFALPSRDFF
ncbi:hypothetical protein TNCV_3897761 [Trichonephila clavipes]|nr:hypothetical protein TNCV_3897761 [Trichonephila clavipes]